VQGLELLCPFGDPQNLGALVRTAYAFGVSRVVLLKEAAHPLLPKAIKASSGAILKIPLFFGPSIHQIQAPAVALDLNGTPLNGKIWPQSLRLLLGEEGPGIPADFRGERLTLPMKNPMESLNAAVAAGIVIYTLSQEPK
jgi:tRNA G18 (ribose-2'-O)-methylase SpoU